MGTTQKIQHEIPGHDVETLVASCAERCLLDGSSVVYFIIIKLAGVTFACTVYI